MASPKPAPPLELPSLAATSASTTKLSANPFTRRRSSASSAFSTTPLASSKSPSATKAISSFSSTATLPQTVIPSEARNLPFPSPMPPANSPPPSIPKRSRASLPANRPPSTLPPKNVSSIASSLSPPRALSNPPTTFPTAASPSLSPNPASLP